MIFDKTKMVSLKISISKLGKEGEKKFPTFAR